MSQDNRTEQATPHRRQKAREKGQVPRSRELSSALALVAVILLMRSEATGFAKGWRSFLRQMLAMSFTSDNLHILRVFSIMIARWSAPALILGMLISMAASVAQTGFVFSVSALSIKWERFSPVANIQRIFSISGAANWLKTIVPLVAIMYLLGQMLMRDWSQLLLLNTRTYQDSFAWLANRLFEACWKAGMVFLVWSAADYMLQRYNFSRQLRMTKQEVQQESKDLQGNPMIKGRVKRLQREMRRRFMMRDVARAAVVITNPTHFAVALEYRPGEMSAPVVVAKGRNLIAKQIREEATWHNIPIIRNPPLAQTLYRTVQIGKSIPPALYAGVAEILAFVFRSQTRARQIGSSLAKAPVAHSRT